MRKMIFLLLMLPLFGIAQNKSLISTDRYFPKADKVQQFEKALGLHAQKFHKGDQKWRVYSIETGPDAGGYLVVEGPTNWDGVDKRGDLGAAHMKDFETTIQPLLKDRTSTMYLSFREELSTVQQSAYSEKISIHHVYVKPGFVSAMPGLISSMKKVWEADASTIAVYEASLSGEPQFLIVTRYKSGLKERDIVPAVMQTRFTSANGEGSWAKYLTTVQEAVDHQWSELLFHKPEMDSK